MRPLLVAKCVGRYKHQKTNHLATEKCDLMSKSVFVEVIFHRRCITTQLVFAAVVSTARLFRRQHPFTKLFCLETRLNTADYPNGSNGQCRTGIHRHHQLSVRLRIQGSPSSVVESISHKISIQYIP